VKKSTGLFVRCRSCGHAVYKESERCPRCGHRMHWMSKAVAVKVIAAILAVALSLALVAWLGVHEAHLSTPSADMP